MAGILNEEQSEMIKKIAKTMKLLNFDGWLCEGSEFEDKNGNIVPCNVFFNNDKDVSFLASYDGEFLEGHGIKKNDIPLDVLYYAGLEGMVMKIVNGASLEEAEEMVRDIEIRKDFATALENVENGYELSYPLSYGLSRYDVSNLAILHRDREDLRDKIYDLLEDCNFHSENFDFEQGNYDKYIIKEDEPDKPKTPKEIANSYIEKYGENALIQYKADSVDYTKMTKEQKQVYGIINSHIKNKEFNDRLNEGVDKIFNDDRFKEWINFSKNFHDYSFNNTMMIFVQCPNATMVASKTEWAKMGRRINEENFGKGIMISRPCFNEFSDLEKLNNYLDRQVMEGRMTEDAANNYRAIFDEEGKVEILNGFKYERVYDVSMTNGKEIPKNETRETLDLSLEHFNDIKSALCEISEENGVNITYAKEDDGKLSNAFGYFSPMDNVIVVRDTDYDEEPRSEADVIRTTAHEIAHSMLHGKEMLASGVDSSDKAVSRSEKEIEAEGTALLVCEHLGFDSGANSYGYLAGYLPENKEERVKILKNATDKILKCSAEINARLDEKLSDLEKDMVLVSCYGEVQEMTREDALNFYKEAMYSCDPQSSEFERYENIVDGLKEGLDRVDDGDEFAWTDENIKTLKEEKSSKKQKGQEK